MSRLASNTVQSTIAGTSNALGGMLSMVAVARLLGPAGAGTVGLAVWIAGTAITVGDLGLPLTVARFIPDLEARGQAEDARNFAAAFFKPLALTTLLGAALALALFAFDAPLRAHFASLPFAEQGARLWLEIGALFASQAIGNYAQGALRGSQRFALFARLAALSFLVQLGAVALGGALGGVEGALLGYCAGNLIFAAYALASVGISGAIDAGLRARAWRFSLASWGVGLIAAIVWSRTEIAFLNYWRGAHEAGLYSVAWTVGQAATQAPLLMTGALLATFAQRHAVGDAIGLQSAYATSLRLMAFLIFPASFGAAAIAPALVPLVFGHAFDAAIDATALLVAAQSFGALTAVTTALLFATERNGTMVRIGAVGAAGVLAAGMFVIPAYGLMGAVVARVAIQIAATAATFVYVDRALDGRTPYGALARIVAAASGCALAARGIVNSAPGALGMAAAIILGAAVYVALARLLGALPAEDVESLRLVCARAPRWAAAPLERAVRVLG